MFGGIEVQATKFVFDGFNNWRAGESRTKVHENNNGHRQAMLTSVSSHKEAGPTDYLATKQVEEERRWSQILKRLLDVLKFLAMRGLALGA